MIRVVLTVWLLLCTHTASSYKICSLEKGGGVCPDHNTCCPTATPGLSACISAKKGEQGACCSDDGLGVTGCPSGYECLRQSLRGNHNNTTTATSQSHLYCHRIDPDYNGTKPKPVKMPRYKLCTLPRSVMTQVYGLPMKESPSNHGDSFLNKSDNNDDNEQGRNLLMAKEETAKNDNIRGNTDNQQNNDNDDTIPNVAYFSTMGSLTSKNPRDLENQERVTTVLIMVHGSGRTAEEYLYGAVSSLPPDQQNPQNSTMMVLSPWFLDLDDDKYNNYQEGQGNENDYPMASSSQDTSSQDEHHRRDNIPIPLPPNTLRWIEEGPVLTHTWRYGAEAINSTISSFAAIDRLVETLVIDGRLRFPALQRILIAGHSAGGQFVQRWALLSNSPAWKAKPEVAIRVIPANPRCFAFLDDRRFVDENSNNNNSNNKDGTTKDFRRPNDDVIASCPDYNEWIWGLDKGGNITAPYKDQAIANAGGVQSLAYRYVTQRRLVYLAGGADLQVFDDDCGSVLQGKTRRERSRAFMASLLLAYPDELQKNKRHTRLVVPGVPHDHSLMFQSPEGQEALFGDEYDVEGDSIDEELLLLD